MSTNIKKECQKYENKKIEYIYSKTKSTNTA